MDPVQFLKRILFFSLDRIIIYGNKLYDLRKLVGLPVWFVGPCTYVTYHNLSSVANLYELEDLGVDFLKMRFSLRLVFLFFMELIIFFIGNLDVSRSRENEGTDRDIEGVGWDMSIPLKLFLGLDGNGSLFAQTSA